MTTLNCEYLPLQASKCVVVLDCKRTQVKHSVVVGTETQNIFPDIGTIVRCAQGSNVGGFSVQTIGGFNYLATYLAFVVVVFFQTL